MQEICSLGMDKPSRADFRVEQLVDAFADGQLPALAVTSDRPFVAGRATLADRGSLRAELINERLHGRAVRSCLVTVRINPRRQYRHRGR